MGQPVSVSRDIAAPPDRVYALVADVTRMGEWSPETTRCSWLGASVGPAVGAWFRGYNHNGTRFWATRCQVTAADPGRVFAFEVKPRPFPAQARWEYRFEETSSGCRVTETVEDLRIRLGAWIGNKISGVTDRALRNRDTMEQTLERIAQAAENTTA